MNLQLQLLIKMLLIASLCLSSSALYVLYHTHQQAITEAGQTAKRVESIMRKQIIEMFQHNDFKRSFPDTNLWRHVKSLPGSCTQFLSRAQSRQRSLCNELTDENSDYPDWFGQLYQYLFMPLPEIKRPVNFHAMKYGTVLVTLNLQAETARAWVNVRVTSKVVTISLLALCILVFITIRRLLRPAHHIVQGLEQMRQGHLDTRLPEFDISQWRRTSSAINALAATQQHILSENKKLTLKLMNAQEEEHRYISRELHDEFGQCLAGINAMLTSVSQSAKQDCPQLLPELQSISHITSQMMAALRHLLTRLRPAEIDDLGLTTSLKQLIKSWNQRNANTLYSLQIHTELDQLNEPLPTNIYRIVQECLTNIAKHAHANNASIVIDQYDNDLIILIRDDGIAQQSITTKTNGIGLLGIHERVNALAGSIQLSTQNNGGLVIDITLPLSPVKEDAI